MAIDAMRESFNKNEGLSDAMHNKMMDLFKKYLIVGGLPKAVSTFVETRNIMEIRSVQTEVHDLYEVDCTKYEEEHNRRLTRWCPQTLRTRRNGWLSRI